MEMVSGHPSAQTLVCMLFFPLKGTRDPWEKWLVQVLGTCLRDQDTSFQEEGKLQRKTGSCVKDTGANPKGPPLARLGQFEYQVKMH